MGRKRRESQWSQQTRTERQSRMQLRRGREKRIEWLADLCCREVQGEEDIGRAGTKCNYRKPAPSGSGRSRHTKLKKWRRNYSQAYGISGQQEPDKTTVREHYGSTARAHNMAASAATKPNLIHTKTFQQGDYGWNQEFGQVKNGEVGPIRYYLYRIRHNEGESISQEEAATQYSPVKIPPLIKVEEKKTVKFAERQEPSWEPSTPLEVLNFLSLRIWSFENWPECREFGVPTNPGIPLDQLVAHMITVVVHKGDGWELLAKQFIERYEGFRVEENRVFPKSPESILYPWSRLELLVYIEDICKKLRSMVGLGTDIYESLYQLGDRSVISTLPRAYSSLVKCRPPPPVRVHALRVPLSGLTKLISQLPQADQQTLRGIFPGNTLMRHLPLISVMTAYPIITTSNEWILT
ncbi:hypothetical protein BIW11_10887 [Tropilaelaps mercedesae]|uniref:Uncharacterized protein n=1 Tax=Tropilaelaps mercedesae TaxID=418985 RepID=A0A1V9XDJ7_9ACAR|nr:hypothetical protein BIW11_10887 [Tropilaelaps mercedesae]